MRVRAFTMRLWPILSPRHCSSRYRSPTRERYRSVFSTSTAATFRSGHWLVGYYDASLATSQHCYIAQQLALLVLIFSSLWMTACACDGGGGKDIDSVEPPKHGALLEYFDSIGDAFTEDGLRKNLEWRKFLEGAQSPVVADNATIGAITCSISTDETGAIWAIAKHIGDGHVVFRVKIFAETRRPRPHDLEFSQPIAGLFHIRTKWWLQDNDAIPKASYFIDQLGRIQYSLTAVALVAMVHNGVLLAVTSQGVVRVANQTVETWIIQNRKMPEWWFGAGVIIASEDKDVIVGRWNPMANHGVVLTKIDYAGGVIKWERVGGPLSDVVHSQYTQDVYLEVHHDRVLLVSWGLSSCIEVFDVVNGELLRRVIIP